MSPAEVAGWQGHFRRHPFDGAERILSMLFSLQCADPRPEDWQVRPWAYNAAELADLSAAKEDRVDAEAEASAQSAWAKMTGG